MTAEIIDKHKNEEPTFQVEHRSHEFITITKMKRNKEYEVDVLVFGKSELEELKKIQDDIYSESSSDTKSLVSKLLGILRKLKKDTH